MAGAAGRVHRCDHPLVRERVAVLRDRRTTTAAFAAALADVGMLLAYEATVDLPLAEASVDTPLERTTLRRPAGPGPVLVPILRAGLGLLDGARRLLPAAPVAMVGVARDEATLLPRAYLHAFPAGTAGREALVLDPMLATGGSAALAIRACREAGAAGVRLLAVLASPEGIARVQAEDPDVILHLAAVDRELDGRGFIRPGLGDAGDRAFGTA